MFEGSHQGAGDWDRQRASFDKLRIRDFLRAAKNSPHPELVEGREMLLQWECYATRQ
jgi:hypothetical protein